MGHQVIGLDSFTDYYERERKLANLFALRNTDGFTLAEADLVTADLQNLIGGVDYVFHLAAQPGVRLSWGRGFSGYVRDNVVATQKLLEALKDSDTLSKFVYASSSSIYGNAEGFPTVEITPPRPVSPYGVTKLAAEHLCNAYLNNFGVPIVVLRYFTV